MRLNDFCRGYTLRIAIVTIFTLLLLSNGSGAIAPDLSGGTIIVSGAATATLTVNAEGGADYTKIQDAIDNAYDGYTIIVSGGTTSTLTYYEKVNVNKMLILHGIDNGAGQPVVDAGGSGSAITLSADRISLEGFKAVNSGYLYPDAGIRIISNNNFIANNEISNTYYEGISLYYTNNNTIAGNSVKSSNGYGIHLYSSSDNVIYDNYFDNVNNMASENSINIWNIGKIPGRNIIGGEYIGGNYWAGPNWTGFSQTCADIDHDGICDNPYSLESNNTDYLPLTIVNKPPDPIYSGVFSSLITDKPAYLRGQAVYTTAVVTNTGNTELNAYVTFTYQKPDLSIALIETKQVAVPNGGSADVLSNYTIPAKGSTQGTWTVKAELLYDSQILDERTTAFQGVRKL